MIFSCREEITLDLPTPPKMVVVQGGIEPGIPPYVILTRNQGFFDPVTNSTYDNLFINDAEITVWTKNDDGTIESIQLDPFPPPLDTLPGYANLFDTAFIKIGKTYHLEIKCKLDGDDKFITATTTIPNITPLDSLWVEQTEDPNDKDFKCDIKAIYTDPDTIGNNILIRSKRITHWVRDTIKYYPADTIKQDNDPLLLLVDCGPDILINGSSFETWFPRPSDNGGFSIGSYRDKHYKSYQNENTPGKDSVLTPSDTVLLKFSQVDEASMKFWRGVVRNVTSGGNPFAEPMNLSSNINGGLGIWTGYGAVYYKIPIVKDTVILKKYIPDILKGEPF